MVTINFDSYEDANAFFQSLAELGAMKAIKELHPQLDVLSQREAKKYVSGLGYPTRYLDRLEEGGFIHKRKRGKEKNSPFVFSRAEIKAAINAIKSTRII